MVSTTKTDDKSAKDMHNAQQRIWRGKDGILAAEVADDHGEGASVGCSIKAFATRASQELPVGCYKRLEVKLMLGIAQPQEKERYSLFFNTCIELSRQLSRVYVYFIAEEGCLIRHQMKALARLLKLPKLEQKFYKRLNLPEENRKMTFVTYPCLTIYSVLPQGSSRLANE